MKTWTLYLPMGAPPSGLSANHRSHWATKARSTDELRALIVFLARGQRIPRMRHMTVRLVWVVADKRVRDDDNLAPMAKVIYDALGSNRGTGLRLVPDDSPEWMTKEHPRIEYRPDEAPHFEVVIEGVPHEPSAQGR